MMTRQLPRLSFYLSLFFPVLTSNNAHALDIRLLPEFNTGLLYYDYTEEDISITSLDERSLDNNRDQIRITRSKNELNFSDVLPVIDGSLSLLINNFYVNFSIQKAFNGQDASQQMEAKAERTADEIITLTLENLTFDAEFDRLKYEISAGYDINDSLSVFAGYMMAETDFTFLAASQFSTDNPQQGSVTTDPFENSIEQEFSYDGPFFGAKYDWLFGNTGAFSASAALALMDGEFQRQTLGIQRPPLTFTGDSVGVNFRAAWTGKTPIPNLLYTFSVSGSSYNFDSDSTDVGDVSELTVGGFAGISYRFGLKPVPRFP